MLVTFMEDDTEEDTVFVSRKFINSMLKNKSLKKSRNNLMMGESSTIILLM